MRRLIEQLLVPHHHPTTHLCNTIILRSSFLSLACLHATLGLWVEHLLYSGVLSISLHVISPLLLIIFDIVQPSCSQYLKQSNAQHE